MTITKKVIRKEVNYGVYLFVLDRYKKEINHQKE